MIPMTPISFEKAYCKQLMKVLHAGADSFDPRGGRVLRQQHAYFEWEGFALLRGMELNPRAIVAEALWMLSGRTDLYSLAKLGCDYATSRARANSSNEHTWRAQFRSFGSDHGTLDGCDQLRRVCRMIVEEPNSRRIAMSAWNPNDLQDMTLPPCHLLYQFCVVHGVVHMHVTQRRVEAIHVAPQGFALLSVIHQLICLVCRRTAGRIHYTCNDFHTYIYDADTAGVMDYARRVASTELVNHYLPVGAGVGWDNIILDWNNIQVHWDRDNNTPAIDAMLDLFCKHHVAGGDVFEFNNYKPKVRLLRPQGEG